MDTSTSREIERLITEAAGSRANISGSRTVGGGCINDAHSIWLKDGRQFFVKLNSPGLVHMFRREAEGLEALQGGGLLRVPRVVGVGASATAAFLVLEQIKPGPRKGNFFEKLGRGLAQLHQQPVGAAFGFATDNFLGSSPQPNGLALNWVQFWAGQRLGFQLQLAVETGNGSPELQELGQKLIGRLDAELGDSCEPPALIHGDLWSGNYMADEVGDPVLIDPAVYYANREAEFGMITLFGGVDAVFYDAYNEVWPLAAGASERIEIYRLYHLLNHLNLFGSGYLGGCLDILRKYA